MNKIAGLWKSGPKGKAICIGCVVVLLMILGAFVDDEESDGGGGGGRGVNYSGEKFVDVFTEIKDDEPKFVSSRCTHSGERKYSFGFSRFVHAKRSGAPSPKK